MIRLVPADVAVKNNVVPVNRAGWTLILSTADPSNIYALDDVKFLTGYNIQAVVASEEAIKRIAGLYAVEKDGRGRPPDERVRLRQARARPILDDLETWLHTQLPRISGKSELAKAIRYALSRMKKLRPYLDHGFLEADNN